jgi:hypothetical protein
VAVVMANLDRLPDTPENHAVHKDIKAYLTWLTKCRWSPTNDGINI